MAEAPQLTHSQRVFISYRSKDPDASLARTFYQSLKNAGHQPFMAAESIRLGENWPQRIDKELEQSDYLLLLLSEQSATSEMVTEEVRRARELRQINPKDKPIILPIRVNFPFSEPLNYDLRSYLQPIQQEQWQSEADTPAILEKILRLFANNETPTTVEPETTPVYAVETLSSPPLPAAELELPGGQMELASPFYVQREPWESRCYQQIEHSAGLIRIKAPRQMGKTSLLARINHHGTDQGYQTISIDFRQFEANIFHDFNQFLKRFCALVSRKIGISPKKIEEHWDDELFGDKENCCEYFEQVILTSLTVPLILGLDGLDRIFPYNDTASEFLSLLRAWYEEGKIKNTWEKLRLIIVHSTESYVKIDTNHSPLNVGLPVKLQDFTSKQVLELAQLHGLNWSSKEIEDLMEMIGGHPYLVRVGLYNIAQKNLTLSQLLQKAPTDEGIYGEHLRRHLWNLQQHPDLFKAFKKVINSTEPIGLETTEKFKLNGMGLVDLQDNKVKLRYEKLYRSYFWECLKVN